jgi:hypothetical protein
MELFDRTGDTGQTNRRSSDTARTDAELLTHNLDRPDDARRQGRLPQASDTERFATRGDVYLLATDARLVEGARFELLERRGVDQAVRGTIELESTISDSEGMLVNARVETTALVRNDALDDRLIDTIERRVRGEGAHLLHVDTADLQLRKNLARRGYGAEDTYLFVADVLEQAGESIDAALRARGPMSRASDRLVMVHAGDALAAHLNELLEGKGLNAGEVVSYSALTGELELSDRSDDLEAGIIDALASVSMAEWLAVEIETDRGPIAIGAELVANIDWTAMTALRELPASAPTATAERPRVLRSIDDEVRSRQRLQAVTDAIQEALPSLTLTRLTDWNPIVDDYRGHPVEPPRQLRFGVEIAPGKVTEVWVPDDSRLEMSGVIAAVEELVKLEELFPNIEIEALAFDYSHPYMVSHGLDAGPVDGYCASTETVIHLNADYAMINRNAFRDDLDAMSRDAKHFTPYDAPAVVATLTHEFWHRVEMRLEKTNIKELETMRTAISESLFGAPINLDMVFPMQGWGPMPGQIPMLRAIKDQVSTYATSSKWELSAELFREWRLASEPRPVAQAFGDAVQALRELGAETTLATLTSLFPFLDDAARNEGGHVHTHDPIDVAAAKLPTELA